MQGYEPIDIAFNINGGGKTFGGLGCNPPQWTNAFIDADPTQANWWMAVGATQAYGGPDKYPGPGSLVSHVELYVLKE